MKKYLLITIKFSGDIFVYAFVFVYESHLFREIYTVFYETDNKYFQKEYCCHAGVIVYALIYGERKDRDEKDK